MPLSRSELMKRVRQRDTAPEVALRKALFKLGMRYRIGHRVGTVRADIVFPCARIAVFVDGCFWHGCPTHGTQPKTNGSYWGPKLVANRERDQRQTKGLEELGWTVIRVWEHDCKPPDRSIIERIATLAGASLGRAKAS